MHIKYLLIITLLFANAVVKGTDMNTSSNDTLPLIVAGLNSSINTMLNNSENYDFRIDTRRDKTTIVITEPNRFIFDNESLEIQFPIGKLLWLNSAAGHIYGISVNPHLDLLTLDEAFALLKELAKQINSHTEWESQEADYLDQEAFKQRIKDVEREKFRWTQYRWTSGDSRMYIVLKRMYKADSSSDDSNDWYIIDVNIENDKLQHKYLNQTYETRLEANGAENKPLPLSYWLERDGH